jgi:hypothetical protein
VKQVQLNYPTLGFVVVTRAMIGLGVGLLVADRIAPGHRRTIGAALVGAGAAATVPAIRAILQGTRAA